MDDAFVLLALTTFFISAVIWQNTSKYMYQALYVSSGVQHDIPATFLTDSEKYLKGQIGIILMFMTGLWSIKISFLLFFRRLGENVSGQQIHWWCVAVYTAATYFIGVGTIEYHCLAPSLITIATTCSGQKSSYFEKTTLAVNLAMDVSTDLFSTYHLPILLWETFT